MLLGFSEPSDIRALFGKCRAVGNSIGASEPVAQFAVALLGVEPVGKALARLPRAGTR